MLAQLLDRVAAVLQDAGVAVDVGDRAAARGGVHVRGVVGHQPEVLLVGLDLAQVHRAHGAVLDRQLVGPAGAVVGHRERVRGRRAVARPVAAPGCGAFPLGGRWDRRTLGAHVCLLSAVSDALYPIMRNPRPPAASPGANRGSAVRQALVRGDARARAAGDAARGRRAGRAEARAAAASAGGAGALATDAGRCRRPVPARSPASGALPSARSGTAPRSGSSGGPSAR